MNETLWKSGKTIHLVSEYVCCLLGGVCFHLLLIQPLKYPHFQERQEFVSYEEVQISYLWTVEHFSSLFLSQETVVSKAQGSL